MHGKEVSHDRVKPLLRLFRQGGGGGLHSFLHRLSPLPGQHQWWLDLKYHVAQKHEHLFIKVNQYFERNIQFAFHPKILRFVFLEKKQCKITPSFAGQPKCDLLPAVLRPWSQVGLFSLRPQISLTTSHFLCQVHPISNIFPKTIIQNSPRLQCKYISLVHRPQPNSSPIYEQYQILNAKLGFKAQIRFWYYPENWLIKIMIFNALLSVRSE